jgi:hypothetical protein
MNIKEIDEQIEILQKQRRILKEAEEAKESAPFINRLGLDVFNFLNTLKGFGPGKMRLLCAMKNVTPDMIKKSFPLFLRLDEHDIRNIVAAVNR